MKIDIIQNKRYAKLSKDFNKIHIDRLYAKKFFVKKPICHGTNIVIKILKRFRIKKISSLKIIFHNFIKIKEKFFFKKTKNKINIFKNEKKITINYNKKNESSFNDIKNHLNLISNYVGNFKKDKFPSIILNIDLECVYSKKQFKKFIKIRKNIYKLIIINKFFKSEILFAKLQPKQIIKIKSKKKKMSGKVLIFGQYSDLGNYTFDYLKSKGYNVQFFKGYFTKLNKIGDKLNKYKKYDYIFYYFTSKIVPFKKKYDFENYHIFKKICNFYLNENPKIFYPSSKYVEDKKKEYKYYINSKIKSEKFIDSLNNKNVEYFRLPQLKSSQTYNLFGEYQGQKINFIQKYIDKFMKT